MTSASVKNFQLVAHGQPVRGMVGQMEPLDLNKLPAPNPHSLSLAQFQQERTIIQFGRVGEDSFTMDFAYPMTALQARQTVVQKVPTAPNFCSSSVQSTRSYILASKPNSISVSLIKFPHAGVCHLTQQFCCENGQRNELIRAITKTSSPNNAASCFSMPWQTQFSMFDRLIFNMASTLI